jgi:molybdopterin-guanine dinucleotide biosynthesis protein A
MVSLKEQADVIVPKWEDYFQPMHAIYARQPVLTALNHALAHGKKRMISFYDDVSVKSIEPATIQQFDPEGYTFFNANTPEELAEAERIWSKIQKHL